MSMFACAGKRIIKWPVTVNEPLDGGGAKKHQFSVEFEILGQTEQDETMRGAPAGDRDVDLLARVLHGWGEDGPRGADKQPVTFSEEAKSELLELQNARAGILRAYFEAAAGNGAARKNSR